MDSPWKVLLIGLAKHDSLIRKLSREGHQIQATDILSEAYSCLAANHYDLIIIDADQNPADVAMVCDWIGIRASRAQIVQLTRWRDKSGAASAVSKRWSSGTLEA